MADDRKRAIALKAADAKTLLQRQLPYVLSVLTPAQLAQVQRVLDAEVVNPEIASLVFAIFEQHTIDHVWERPPDRHQDR